jgi:hypothetical protein
MDWHLNHAALAALMNDVEEQLIDVFQDIEASIRKICDLRDHHNRNVPVLIHGYAYITPRESPRDCSPGPPVVSGPWLKKRLDDLGIRDPHVQKTLAVRVIDRLNEFYEKRIAAPAISGVRYVDLRPLVVEAQVGRIEAYGEMERRDPLRRRLLERHRFESLRTAAEWLVSIGQVSSQENAMHAMRLPC